jgi:excisionase family DNA binding protein
MDSINRGEELLTLSEVAAYLKIAEKTVHRMVQKDEIPCFKVASQWRFQKEQIDQWIRGKMKGPAQSAGSRLLETSPHKVSLSQLITREFILMDIKNGDKRSVLSQLIAPLVNAKMVENKEAYLEKLLSRENMITTGLAKGVALPHVRNPQEIQAPFPAVVLGICREGCDYAALDGQPTNLFFLIFSDSVTVHLRLTSRINRILLKEGLITSLNKAASVDEVMDLLFSEDEEIRKLDEERFKTEGSL